MHREEILFIEAYFRRSFIKMENDLLHLLTSDNKVSICILDYIIYGVKRTEHKLLEILSIEIL